MNYLISFGIGLLVVLGIILGVYTIIGWTMISDGASEDLGKWSTRWCKVSGVVVILGFIFLLGCAITGTKLY